MKLQERIDNLILKELNYNKTQINEDTDSDYDNYVKFLNICTKEVQTQVDSSILLTKMKYEDTKQAYSNFMYEAKQDDLSPKYNKYGSLIIALKLENDVIADVNLDKSHVTGIIKCKTTLDKKAFDAIIKTKKLPYQSDIQYPYIIFKVRSFSM